MVEGRERERESTGRGALHHQQHAPESRREGHTERERERDRQTDTDRDRERSIRH